MATLTSVLAELSCVVAKAETSNSANAKHLSVRLKSYLAQGSETERLLCHFKVSSSFQLPIVSLLEDQQLSELSKFLVDVQGTQDHCECVLVDTPVASSDASQAPVTSTLAVSLLRHQGKDSPAGGHGNPVDRRGDDGDENRMSGSGAGEAAGRQEGRASHGKEGKVRVTLTTAKSPDVGPASSSSLGGERGGKPGTSLHIRFYSEKLMMLSEGKALHDFLQDTKLFQPAVHISFTLDIEGQTSRSTFRSQGYMELKGQAINVDPQYLTRRATLASRVYAGLGESRAGAAMAVRCFALHVTACRLEPAHRHVACRVRLYGPHGVPLQMAVPHHISHDLSSLADWPRLGFTPVPRDSGQPGGDTAWLDLTVTDRSTLPGWARSGHSALDLSFICSPPSHLTGTSSELMQHVRSSLGRVGQRDLCDTATAALRHLYFSDSDCDVANDLRKVNSSRLDVFVPMISQSMADIYARSSNEIFRRRMDHLTEANSTPGVKKALQQALDFLLDPGVTAREARATAQPSSSPQGPDPHLGSHGKFHAGPSEGSATCPGGSHGASAAGSIQPPRGVLAHATDSCDSGQHFELQRGCPCCREDETTMHANACPLKREEQEEDSWVSQMEEELMLQ